jgi:peptidoglycan hydrolase-like protein with peptidoglycan-binding domain
MKKIEAASALVIVVASACSAEDVTCIDANGMRPCEAEKPTEATLPERLQGLTTDLSLGAEGSDVLSVQEYFGLSGYFPSERLEQGYPAWRPIVSESPEPGVFDQRTEEAVLHFQRAVGLVETGVVDAATRSLMQRPRCGVPESLHSGMEVEKYALTASGPWPKRDLTWFVVNTDDGLGLPAVRAAVSAGFASWALNAPLRFTQAASAAAADITITWVPSSQMNNPNAVAETAPPVSGGDIKMNQQFPWVISTTTTGSQVDVQTYILHEAGHALGLQHTGAGPATMNPLQPGTDPDRDAQGRINIDLDDKVAIGLQYPDWDFFTDGLASAIDVGGTAASPSIWILGQSHQLNGYRVYQRIGSSWVFSKNNAGQSDNFAAYRIAVDPSGVPYAIQEGGAIFRRTTSTAQNGSWVSLASGTCAADIDVGSDGSVWIVGCSPTTGIRKLSGSTFGTAIGSGVSRIGVDAAGTPWVVFFDNRIGRLQNGSLQVLVGGGVNIDAGPVSSFGFSPPTPISFAHVFGTAQVGPDYETYIWRDPLGSDPALPQTQEWYHLAGNGVDLSFAPDGFAWIVSADHTIYKQRRTFRP